MKEINKRMKINYSNKLDTKDDYNICEFFLIIHFVNNTYNISEY